MIRKLILRRLDAEEKALGESLDTSERSAHVTQIIFATPSTFLRPQHIREDWDRATAVMSRR
jgi:hypothetical protein